MSDTRAEITVREACRRRMALDGADAQALDGALTITERERDAAESEVARLRGLLGDMEYVHFPNGLASLCPACYLTPGMGHSVDCRLAAALAAERRTDHG